MNMMDPIFSIFIDLTIAADLVLTGFTLSIQGLFFLSRLFIRQSPG